MMAMSPFYSSRDQQHQRHLLRRQLHRSHDNPGPAKVLVRSLAC
jgi:hypothetical protein